MGDIVTVIRVKFSRTGGRFHAYSDDLPTLHVFGKTEASVRADVPGIIRALYKSNQKRDVIVKEVGTKEFKRKPLRQATSVEYVAGLEVAA